MDLSTQLEQVNFVSGKNADRLNFLDLRFSNLPLDYLNGVLPTAQFGKESVVNFGIGSDTVAVKAFDAYSQPISVIEPDNSTPSAPFLPVKFPAVSSDSSFNDPQIIYGQSAKDGSSHVLKSQGNSIPGAKLLIQDYTLKKGLAGDIVSGYLPQSAGVSSSVSIAALRQAYAAQKYKEIQLANDVDFASQIQAHFGVKPKHADDTSYFIGGSSSMIDINPIVNQNLSGNEQANYKASPIGNGSSKIKFTADTYGVVMGIYRCTPVLDYAHIGIDRSLCKTDASDFVIPEMDSIGMQQNYLFEVQAPSFNGTKVGFIQDQNFTKSYGYAPRYAEYKTNYDKYNGDFCFTLDSWVTGLPADMIDEICRQNVSSMQIAPELFNCRPSLCNSIFVNQNNYVVSDDKLYIGMVNMAYVTRNLSRYGLPYSN